MDQLVKPSEAAQAGNDAAPTSPGPPPAEDDDMVESELLVEEVSIDGMCGVY